MIDGYIEATYLSEKIDKIVFYLATRPGSFRDRFAETALPAAGLSVDSFPESQRKHVATVLGTIANRSEASLEELQNAAEKIMSLQFHLNWYLERCREQEIIERYEAAQK